MTSYPKTPTVRAPRYLRWVASLPCIVCGLEGSTQAAHANNGKGMGKKASDLATFPMCFHHHFDHDMGGRLKKEERRELEAQYVEQTQERARREGRPEMELLCEKA